MLQALDSLPNLADNDLPGVYLEIEGRPNEAFITKSLNASELKLLRVQLPSDDSTKSARATVFATPGGINKLRTKVENFATKNSKRRDGTEGRPQNADLVQSIAAITEAGLRALWRSPEQKFPDGNMEVPWELWLEKNQADEFIAAAAEFGVIVGGDSIEFPEDIVVIAMATRDSLAVAVRRLTGIRALAAPTVTADYFDSMEVMEQAAWTGNILDNTSFSFGNDPGFVTLLDTGIGRQHPLIAPALDAADRHAAEFAWGVEDYRGHGTELAGLALYGDLVGPAQTTVPLTISHKLESVKIIPDADYNPHHLLGAITRNAVDVAEVSGERRRTFTMATSTEDDSPHDGAPTSWSSALDQLVAGASGDSRNKRLFVVSAGNSDQSRYTNIDYLAVSDHPDNEIESPAQSWNAICVGAMTNKVVLPVDETNTPIAPIGDLSPSSRTASWSSHWPLKPDVVYEGGNWITSAPPPPLRHGYLSLLTTDLNYPLRSFTLTSDTSASTALAAKNITELWSDYPTLWPETIRGLFVSSARWTPQMLSHLPMEPQKGNYEPLFKRYGYGVPDMPRAKRSASNALTLLVEDTIIPYRKPDSGSDPVHNEMKLFNLPWPVEELRGLGQTQVTLRVTLSSFIEPNPSEPARGSKFRYASHNLRFKLNRPNENEAQFMARISAAAARPEEPELVEEDDGWKYGSNRRDVGSLHIDELTCAASDLARRNMILVHPVTGWWKSKSTKDPEELEARFSLIIEIDAEHVESKLYAEVQAKIAISASVAIDT